MAAAWMDCAASWKVEAVPAATNCEIESEALARRIARLLFFLRLGLCMYTAQSGIVEWTGERGLNQNTYTRLQSRVVTR